ncbi:hypothetical protein [Streptomyces sp. NPDC090021]|uniref:hypothetical protein n=1 Tax=Streptomyces sp. NPDC090021 TaxID=3365919 RepID=UPI003810547E
MDHGTGWTYAAGGTPAAGPEDALRLVRGAVRGEPGGRVETLLATCTMCGAEEDEFEVAAGECFCVGCCIPLGITDGDVRSGARRWRLEPTGTPLPPSSPGPGLEPGDLPRCPAGHDVFQVAVALSFTAEGEVRGLSVGLRCPVDGALCLYVDDARVVAYGA